jgi:NAD(P) transhydrogenase subunit beta
LQTTFLVNPIWIDLAYLLAACLFILGIKGLAHPRTAVRGNLVGALGMLIAAVVTLLARGLDFGVILAGAAAGGLTGALFAYKVRMTAMPQMVALLNGFGGGASTLVAGAAMMQTASPDLPTSVATAATGLVGAVTFWGSLVAFAKLQEFLLSGRQVLFAGQKALNALLGLASLLGCAWVVAEPTSATAYWSLVAVSSALGVLLVIPIGGADMPVVISLLNSYSGIAGAMAGFLLSNTVLIISGALVGASGIILSQIMCKAMNRSLANVLFGVLGPAPGAASGDEIYAGKVKATTPEEVAMLLSGARRVVIVPGYGMAVAQAQHAVRSLANLLESKGAEVEFAIHPVAGRMPGHMNVLLAEADVPYDKLKEMDVINPGFPQTDVVLVIGANDVVNPLARTDPTSPIAGMPILDVDKARTVVIIKRSLSPGFAGIPNPLFAADNALLLFQDGRKAIQDLIAAVKET